MKTKKNMNGILFSMYTRISQLLYDNGFDVSIRKRGGTKYVLQETLPILLSCITDQPKNCNKRECNGLLYIKQHKTFDNELRIDNDANVIRCTDCDNVINIFTKGQYNMTKVEDVDKKHKVM